MAYEDYPKEFIDLANSVESKRPRTIIQHILKYGSITTEEIEDVYGYKHPPRAIRDVKEHGLPIVMKMVSKGGKRMAQYSFGDPKDINRSSKTSGRKNISKSVRDALIAKYGPVDFIYLEKTDPKDLQVDHRIPYEIAGEAGDMDDVDRFMLLSASANRLKSHACENCPNWSTRDRNVCLSCFWAYPENYTHVACRSECVLPIVLTDDDDIRHWQELSRKIGRREAMGTVKGFISKGLREGF